MLTIPKTLAGLSCGLIHYTLWVTAPRCNMKANWRSSVKLVRDRVPEIIIEDGRKPIYHIADIEEYKRELFKKVEEELNEFREDPCVEEAADLVEAVYALLEAHKHFLFDVAEAGMKKNSIVGSFARGVILERVDD